MIVSLYAALLALIFVGLAFKTIKQRIKYQQRVGDGGKHVLQQHIRAHANLAEYAPFALLLILLLEMQNTSIYALHALGILLLFGRVVHAYGLIKTETYSEDGTFTGKMLCRQIGMLSTLSVLIIASVMLLISSI
jgi:uncharacterized protein